MKISRKNRFIRTSAVILTGTILFTTVTQAASITKKIDASFRSIKLFYNNQIKPMAQEPFIYNGSVYLPVRAVAELVDKNVQWDNASNSVFITDKTSAVSNTLVQQLQTEVSSKNFTIAKLTAEKSALDAKVKELETQIAEKGATGDLKATLAHLEDYFYKDYDIDWKFKLTESSSRINVEVSFDSRTYGKKWDNLSSSSKNSLFRDICKEIRIDHKDIAINGEVIDSRTDKTIGAFSYSKSNSFSYTADNTYSFSDLEKELKKTYKNINSTIDIYDIKIEGDDDDITFTIVVELYDRTLERAWQDLVKDNPRLIRNLMWDIEDAIKENYNPKYIQGYIEDRDNSYNTLTKYEDGSFTYH